MRPFSLCVPTKIVFGAGASDNIADAVSGIGGKALIVSYGRRAYLDRLMANVERSLTAVGIGYVYFLGISANPRLSEVREAVELARREGVDCCIAIGGGSVMDATKAIAAGVLYDGDVWKMFNSRASEKVSVPPVAALPTVMIPTVAATSSETNCVSVVTNDELGEKVGLSAPCLYPRAAIIDPALTVSVPAKMTAAGAVDAMSHILEAYVNGDQASPVQDGLGESLLRSVMTELPAVLRDPADIAHRTNLQWVTTIAWNGWIQAGVYPLTPMHKMGHALSAMYGLTHGVTLAIFMNGYLHEVCRLSPAREARFAALGRRLFGESFAAGLSDGDAATATVDKLVSFFRESGVPVTLREAGIVSPDIDAIRELILRVGAGKDGCLAAIEPIDKERLAKIIAAVE